MKTNGNWLMISALVLFVGAATVVVNAQNQENKQGKTEKAGVIGSAEARKQSAKQTKISFERARQTVLERFPGEILESELERETGRLVYKFEIRDRDRKIQEVAIDAQTGEIVGVEQGDDDEDDELDSPKMQSKLAKEAGISPEQARRTALARVPGTVIESELDMENGKVVYEFEIRDKDGKSFDVLVDAKTGEIVAVENDDEESEPKK